jgi:hypothetical protein
MRKGPTSRSLAISEVSLHAPHEVVDPIDQTLHDDRGQQGHHERVDDDPIDKFDEQVDDDRVHQDVHHEVGEVPLAVCHDGANGCVVG